ncbi:MAG: nucleoside triphosphate pyrophosphohydrolase [Coleofasciculaceae cyanobacterium SM2_1_6]|nr:nucleoside triphosphate pyrophosphohydrolase [Coleofasciculaceae cyanobacterium SM2_1_6]
MTNSPPAPNPDNSTLIALQDLITTVAKLRSRPGGCPWDLAQTPESLIPYVLEEAYEVADAIRSGDPEAIAEELGDLLLQVVLQAQIASEKMVTEGCQSGVTEGCQSGVTERSRSGGFDLQLVAEKINQKLIRRHPHVFGEVQVADAAEVKQNWDQIKEQEKAAKGETTQTLSSKLDRYARTLPPLTAAMKISEKAAAVGFEWEHIQGVWDKFHEELGEFEEALQMGDRSHQEAELGDLLFSLTQLARWYKLNPTEALQGTNQRFAQRFSKIEEMIDRANVAEQSRPITDYTLEELEKFWQQAKKILSDR